MKHTVYSPTAGGAYNQCPASRLKTNFEQYQTRRNAFGLYRTDASSLLDRLYLNDPSLRSLRLNASLATAVPSAMNARRVDAAVEEAKTLRDALNGLAEEESAFVAAAIKAANKEQQIAHEKEMEMHPHTTTPAELPFPLPTVLHPLQIKPFTSYVGGVAFRLQSAAEEEERQRKLREAEEQAIACGGGPGGTGGGGMSTEMKDERVPLPPLPPLPPPPPLVVSEAILFHEHLRALEIEPEVMQVLASKDPSSASIPMSPTAWWEMKDGLASPSACGSFYVVEDRKTRYSSEPAASQGVEYTTEKDTRMVSCHTKPQFDAVGERDHPNGPPEVSTDPFRPPHPTSDLQAVERNSHRLFHWSRLMQSLYHLPLRSLLLPNLHLTPAELEHTLRLVCHLTGVDDGWHPGQGFATPLDPTHPKAGFFENARDNAEGENERAEEDETGGDSGEGKGKEKEDSARHVAEGDEAQRTRHEEGKATEMDPTGMGVQCSQSHSLPSLHHRETLRTPLFQEVSTGEMRDMTTGVKGKEDTEDEWGEMERKQVDFSSTLWKEMMHSHTANRRKGTLEFLDLRHTTIPPYLAGQVGMLLFHPNSSLVRVELEGCAIGDQGAQSMLSFFPFFAHHLRFTASNFSGGRKDEGGITFLAPPSYQLRVLGLQWNKLTTITERFVLSTLPPFPEEVYGEDVKQLREKEKNNETLFAGLRNVQGSLFVGNDSVEESERENDVYTPDASSTNSLVLPSSRSASLDESTIGKRECSGEAEKGKKNALLEHEIASLFEKSLFVNLDGNYLSPEGYRLYKRYQKVFQASKKCPASNGEMGGIEEGMESVSRSSESKQWTGWRQRARSTVVPTLPPVRLAAMAKDALSASLEADRRRLGRWGSSGDGGIERNPSLLRCMLNGLEEQLRHDTFPPEVAIRKKVWRRERRVARAAAMVAPVVNHTGEPSEKNRVDNAEGGPRLEEGTDGDGATVTPTRDVREASFPLCFMDPFYCLRVAAKMVEYPSLGGSPYALESLAPIREVN